MDKCLRSRSAFTARGEDAAVATANITAQGTNLEIGLEQNVTNVETSSQDTVGISDNGNVASTGVENLNLANQLQSMFNAFMIAMQKESAKAASNLESKIDKLFEDLEAKLASKLESKFDKLSENLEAKLGSKLESKFDKLSEDLDAKLATVSENLDTKLNYLPTTWI
jgi:DNA anti-recombination protein RmuC